MEQWAVIRFGGRLYRLRLGRSQQERHIVAEMVDPADPARLAQTMTMAANQDFDELKHEHIPHRCHAVAHALAKHVGAEVVSWSEPPPPRYGLEAMKHIN